MNRGAGSGMARVFARLLLAAVVAVPPFVVHLARTLEETTPYTFIIRTSGPPGVVPEIHTHPVDEADYGARAIGPAARPDPSEHRFSLPPGGYRRFRINPGTVAGIYTIEHIAIVDAHAGETIIPLQDLEPAPPLRLIERGTDRLVVEVTPGAPAPRIEYLPSEPLRLFGSTFHTGALARRFALYVGIAFAGIWLTALVSTRAAAAAVRGARAVDDYGRTFPKTTIVAVALLATIVALHPVLFFGRSLLSQNNGGLWMLYDALPFIPGASDTQIEDARGADIGAMMWQFLGHSVVQRAALREGELPLWNRHNGLGTPLWGQGQSLLVDPLHWLTLLSSDPAPGWDLSFAAHRWVFASGVGVAAWLSVGAWLPAAAVAGMTPFAGVFVYRLNHPAAFALTYAPWALVGWFLLARAKTRSEHAIAGLVIVVASALVMYASPPKEAAVTLAVVALSGLTAVLLHPGQRVRALTTAIISGATLLLVTTPHWLVFLDTLRVMATYYDIPTIRFATANGVRAFVLGTLAEPIVQPSLHAFGVALVVAAALSPRLLVRFPSALACAIATAATFALACGAVPASLLIQVPLLNNIHNTGTTFLVAALVPALVTAAAGIVAIVHASLAQRAVIVAVLSAIAAWIFVGAGGEPMLGRLSGWLTLFALTGMVLVPVLVAGACRVRAHVAPSLALAALAVLLVAPGGTFMDTGLPLLDRMLVQPRVRPHLAVSSPALDAIHADADVPRRVVGLDALMAPGTYVLYGFESVTGPDALFSKANDELLRVGPTGSVVWWTFFETRAFERDAPLLDLLNIGYLLVPFNDSPAAGAPVPMQDVDRIRALARPTAWPRAFFTDRVARYTTADDLVAQARDAKHPIAAVNIVDPIASSMTKDFDSGSGVVVAGENYRLTTNTTTFHVRAPRAGIAVLNETYLPDDFIATLNGQRVPYFRVNHAFKAVALPGAGDWDIRFEYRPHRWGTSLGLAAMGLLLMIGLAVIAVRGGRPRYSEKPAALASS